MNLLIGPCALSREKESEEQSEETEGRQAEKLTVLPSFVLAKMSLLVKGMLHKEAELMLVLWCSAPEGCLLDEGILAAWGAHWKRLWCWGAVEGWEWSSMPTLGNYGVERNFKLLWSTHPCSCKHLEDWHRISRLKVKARGWGKVGKKSQSCLGGQVSDDVSALEKLRRCGVTEWGRGICKAVTFLCPLCLQPHV